LLCRVEGDGCGRRGLVDGIYQPLEERQTLRRDADAATDDDGIVDRGGEVLGLSDLSSA
jgi:hypothetical protein